MATATSETELGAPPAEAPRGGGVRRAGRRVFGALGWLLVVLLALILSLAYHLQLPFAGVVAVETLTAVLNQELRGELEVGTLQNVTYEKLVARDVVFRDPDGHEVIRVDRVVAWPNWGMLWQGTIRIDRARARGGVVTLRPSGEDGRSVSIAETFLPVDPAPPGAPSRPPPRVVIDGIEIVGVRVHGDVPSYAGIDSRDVRAEGRVEIDGDLVLVQVFDGGGVVTGPYEGETPFHHVVGHVRVDDDETEIDFFARLDRGTDRLAARLHLTVPSDESPVVMDLRARASPLRLSTLAEMRVAPGLEALRGTARGHARLYGPVDDLRIRADVATEAGRLHVRAHLPEDGSVDVEAWTDPTLRLAELVPAAPELDLGARARLTLAPPADDGAQERALHVEVQPLSIAGVALPAFTLEGFLDDDALRIGRVEAPHAGGQVEGSGRVGFDGSLDVHVSARIADIGRDPNVRRQAPGARGALTAELDVHASEGGEDLTIDGRLSMRGARYGDVRADRLDVRGRVGGLDADAPSLRVEGEADGLHVGALALGHATLSIDGGAGGYDVSARSQDTASGTELAVRGRARYAGGAIRLEAPALLVDLGEGDPWQGQVDLTFRPGESVSVDPIVLARSGEQVIAQGTYRFQGRDDVEVRLTNVELAALAALAPEALEGLAGRADGLISLGGDIDRDPRGRIALRIRDGGYRHLEGVSGRVNLQLDDHGVSSDVRLDLGDHGEIAIAGPIGIEPRALLRDPARLAEAASLEGLVGHAQDLDLGLLTRLGLIEDLPVQGRISTDVAFSGTARRPGISDAVIVLDRILLDGWDPLRAKLRLTMGEGRLTVREGWLADAGGALGEMQAQVPFELDALPQDLTAAWEQLRRAPWSASVRVADRRTDSWPRPLRDMIPVRGLSVSLSLTADGTSEGPNARLAAVGHFVEAATDDVCAAELRPIVTVDAVLQGDIADADIRGFVGRGDAVLRAEAAMQLPLETWIREGVHRFPPTELFAQLAGVDIAEVPYFCQYGRGAMSASVTAKDLLTGQSVIGAVVDIPRLQMWEQTGEHGEARLSTEYRVHVRAGSSPERDALTACTVLGVAGTEATDGARCREATEARPGEMISRLRVPVTWTEAELLPTYTDGAIITSWSDLSNVRVEPVLAFVPGIVAGDARMDGQVRLVGPWEAMRLNGALALSEGHVQIEGLGQHLHDIEGALELRGDEVIFPRERPLRARDAGGSAEIYGAVGFEGLFPRRLELNLRAESFPIRQEGMVLANLTGRALVTGDITDERTTSTVRTRPFSETQAFQVRLPEQQAGSLQPLEPHGDVLIVGSERPAGTGVASGSYPIVVRIDASDPFWVRRNDFAAQIRANLLATYQDPHLMVAGTATILRGTFEIFGKRFELARGGTLNFDGGTELDPEVNITAVYDIPGRSGATVTVSVGGTLTAPEVAFSSTETSDRAEIIALLVSGGRRDAGAAEQEASQQAASFLAGLTAGILTLGLREEFGDIIPVLAIESQGVGGTRVRVGFDANELIPDFLRGIITGAYIEGFVTASQDQGNAAGSSSGTGGAGGGVTIEFTFPENFLMRGTYVPVDNGSLDVLFEP